MAIMYGTAFGSSWPNNGAGGGFGLYGFTSKAPLWDINALLWNESTLRHMPRVGWEGVTSYVPPTIVPAFTYTPYQYDSTTGAYAAGGGGASCFRVYVTPPGGARFVLYSSGQPVYLDWNGSNWQFLTDTSSPYYMASGVGTVPAGWLLSTPGILNNCFYPDGVTPLSTNYRILDKASLWEEGTWTVDCYGMGVQTTDLSVFESPPSKLEDTLVWSFTVGGYAPLPIEPTVELGRGGAVAYDPFAGYAVYHDNYT